MTAVMTMIVWLVAVPLYAQSQLDQPPTKKESAPRKRERPVSFVMDEHPSLRVRKALRLDFQVKTQADWRDYSNERVASSKQGFDMHRARAGVQGTVLKYAEFQVERELRDTTDPWRDAFVNARPVRALQIQGGRFKIPFGLEQLTGGLDLDFAYRSLASTYLAPGRDVGIMAHGGLFGDVLKYQLGTFHRGGENVRASEHADPQSQRTSAGRIVFKPWDRKRAFRPLRNLAFGAAYTSSRLPEGLNSLRAHTIADESFFPRVYVKGSRQRLGGELQWRNGPVSIGSELMRISDERRAQGIRDESLPDLVARGWYLSGTWLMTGERKADEIKVAKPLHHGGVGALELAARTEGIRQGGGHTSDTNRLILPSPRAANLLETGNRVATLGVNWYLNRFVKIQANLIREHRREGARYDEGGRAIPGQPPSWSRTFRIQFGL